MSLIRVGSLFGGVYSPFISAQTLSSAPKTESREGFTLAALTRPLLKEGDWVEKAEWAEVGVAQDEILLVINPGPFEDGAEKEESLELLFVEEPEDGATTQPTIEGPRLATALFDGFSWRRISILLAPMGWGQKVAAQFMPGRKQQVFHLPEV